MPFQDDTGIDYDERRNPLVAAFGAFASQVERMVVVNLSWSVHLLPALITVANADLPVWVRALGIAYTGIALIPATGVLYALAMRGSRFEHLNLEVARDAWRDMFVPSFGVFLPMLCMFGVLSLLSQIFAENGFVLGDTLLRLAVLLLLTCANYWGVLLVEDPSRSAWAILTRSALLVWRYPLPTLLLCGAVCLVLLLSVISVGGLFLAAPILMALLQVEMVRYIHRQGFSLATK
jgi:hypothetical protein